MKVAVLNYTGDRANWGCRATSRELLKFLENVLAPAGKVNFVLVPMLERTPAYFFVARHLEARLRKALAKKRLGLVDVVIMMVAGIVLYRTLLWRVFTSRYVFFQAEGTMTGTDFLKGTSLLLLPSIASRLFKKKVVSLNQSVFSAHESFDHVLKQCFEKFDLFAVREAASYHYARRLGLRETRLIPDTAFLTTSSGTKPEELIDPDLEGDYFCVSGSSIIEFVCLDQLVAVIRQVTEEYELLPVLLISSKQDRVLRDRIQEDLGVVHSVRAEATYQQVTEVLKHARFLVTGRYHMAILAATVHTPIVFLPSNTYKNDGLIELLQYPLKVRQPQDATGIRADIDEVLTNRVHYSRALRDGLKRVLEMIESGGELVRCHLGRCDAADAGDFAALSPPSDADSGVTPETLRRYQRFQIEIDTKRGLIQPGQLSPVK